MFGFAKSERANISEDDEADFKKMAKAVLALSDRQIVELIEQGKLSEVGGDDEKVQD